MGNEEEEEGCLFPVFITQFFHRRRRPRPSGDVNKIFFCGKWKPGAKGDALFFLISHKIVSLKVGSHVHSR